MNLKEFFIGRTVLAITLLLLLGMSYVWKANAPDEVEPSTSPNATSSYRTTLTGTYMSCLPKHDNFSTGACVVGMEVERGVYYALDFNLLSQAKPELKDGDKLTVSGVFTPMEMISSDTTRHIIGKGILSVADMGSSKPFKNATFEWVYTTYTKDEIPRTDISIKATYEDGTTETKKVDTIQGSCNKYTERDADVYPSSQMIICYYAGLGRYYKVVKNENIYRVQRKEFEESSPDYSPPQQTFQTIIQF